MPGVTPLLAADPGRIGRYRLTGRLDGHAYGGRPGGRSPGGARRSGVEPLVVYLGHATDGEPVTITLLHPVAPGDTAARDRFVAEANAAREVAPFCVARMLDAGFHGDFPYLVSEYIPGPSLAEVVAAEGPPGAEMLHAVAVGAATGLAAIHQAGLVHGHFGPRQLVLGPAGPRVVHSGVTPPYGPATPAGDVLSWARAVLFTATGKPCPDLIEPAPAELRPLQSPFRQLVMECATRDPAARPPAKVIVARLLGHTQTPRGILAAGSRVGGQARTVVAPPAADEDVRVSKPARQPVSRTTAAIAAAVAVGAAIAAIAAILSLRHPGATQGVTADAQPSPSLPAGTPTVSPPRASPIAGMAIPGSLSGTWAGQLQQGNPPLNFAAQIQLSAGQRHGAVSYPSFNCSGVLTLTKKTATRFVFAQGIVSGQQTCGQGTVILTKNGSTLGFAFAPATRGGPGIYGSLSRS
jgi:hypothetical protein